MAHNTQRTDQRGTVIDFTYNDRRQLEKQVVSTLGGSTDGTIRAIKREYDNLARIEKITSYSDTSASTAKNQIEYDYDDFGQVASSWQEHDGVKDGSTLSIGFTYDYTTSSGLLTAGGRPASTVYPSGTLSYGYGTSGSFNDALSRVGALYIQNAAYPTPTETSNYQYSGVSRVMETRHESLISEVALTRYIPATPGDYVNLDRFGQVKSQIWKTSSSLRDQQDYDHDLAGNRIQRDLPATLTTTHDQLYTYDGLNRLADYKQGTIATGAIASPTKDATWELDGLGNWANYLEKTGGTTSLDQDRAHNAVNEIGTIGATTGANWIDPVHDAAGNIIEAPKPGADTTKHKYIWDAWNRLVKVTDSAGTTTIAEFAYDGQNRRIAKIVGSDTYHYYLSEQNQVLEEQKQVGAGSPTLQNDYIWHPHYVDALAIRYDASGVSPVAYYALHDANYNITAMVDGNGAVVERYQYTPYGQVICTNPSFGSPTATSTIGQRNLYTGRELDLETGLYYYRARYYHNTLGRFIGRDPLKYSADDSNLYRYVGNQPLSALDPSGTKIGLRCTCLPGPTYPQIPEVHIGSCPPGYKFEDWIEDDLKAYSMCQAVKQSPNCQGCDEAACDKLMTSILTGIEATWLINIFGIYVGTNTCERYANALDTNLRENGVNAGACVFESSIKTFSTGGFLSPRHVAWEIKLCDGEKIYIDNTAWGGDDHIFFDSDIPVYATPEGPPYATP